MGEKMIALDYYDAGLLGDGGGGDIGWWQDYMRSELARAHEFYQSQVDAHLTQPAQAVDVGDVARASAVHAAVGAIYFNDGSDYLPALWTVVRYLAPELMDELSSKPADVWHRTMAEVDRLTAALPNANGKDTPDAAR